MTSLLFPMKALKVKKKELTVSVSKLTDDSNLQ